MIAHINISTLKGSVQAPPSKSYAHRILICGALAEGASTIGGIVESEDMLATLDCINALGAGYKRSGTTIYISNPAEQKSEVEKINSLVDDSHAEDAAYNAFARTSGETVFPCRESGSTLRFFIPIAAAKGINALFKGTDRLIERGVGIYEEVLPAHGVSVLKGSSGIHVSGTLTPGSYKVPGHISSQFITGLLFALPLLKADSTLELIPPVESRPYIDITVDVLKNFGIIINQTGENTFEIPGNQKYRPGTITAEGDWSNAAFLFAAGQLFASDDFNSVSVSGLVPDSRQGDKACIRMFTELHNTYPTLDIRSCPDLGPVLFAVAAAENGGHFTGTRRLRIKESDRAAAMAEELAKFGIETEVLEDEVIIHPGTLQVPEAVLSGHNDHRIVMALSILCALTGGSITEAQAVRKSFPDFFEVMKELGMEVTLEAD